MRTAFLALGIVAVAGARGVRAQSAGDAAAYVSMVLSPVAAVSPIVLPYMTGAQQQGVGFAGRYGYMQVTGIGSSNTFLADFTGPAGKGSWGLEAGYLSTTCEGCTGNFMAGAHVEGPLAALGSSTGNLLTLGIQGTLGFAKPTNATAWALGADLPLAFSMAAGRVDIVPFVAPGFGVGIVSALPSENAGGRFDLGAGVGVANVAPGLEITAGAEKVFINHGQTVFGLGVSWIRLR